MLIKRVDFVEFAYFKALQRIKLKWTLCDQIGYSIEFDHPISKLTFCLSS